MKSGSKVYQKHRLSPRTVLEAIDEIRGRETGYYNSDEERRQWESTFRDDIEGGYRLPKYEDIYGEWPSRTKMQLLRTVYFIDTEREREIGIGEDYEEAAIPFG